MLSDSDNPLSLSEIRKALGMDYGPNWVHPFWGFGVKELDAQIQEVVDKVKMAGHPCAWTAPIPELPDSATLLRDNIQQEWPW